ncbi:hypothetical protein [Alloacidobacterium sp.]|uniref:hypothetical protein n=1 Tax=Alloacidobacterium sp. TaxID=2951999 RepID=UPI002D779779|nr:hypothetical protein [Alloacidobacterium sp.]
MPDPILLPPLSPEMALTISPDLARRSLVIELHQSWEHPGDRVYKKQLDAVILHKRRAELLAAHWALVRHWDQKLFPGPSRVNSAFPEWSDIIGGIVESAGFGCPLDPLEGTIVVDEDGAEMSELVREMQVDLEYTYTQLVTKCRDLDLFPQLTGDGSMEQSPAQRTSFGRLLARYDRRVLGERRFVIKGNPNSRKSRRFVVFAGAG